MPRPRINSSTTTSSTWLRSPVGRGKLTKVAIPTILPPIRATSSSVPSRSMIALMSPLSKVAVVDHCPSR
jgi:hypothetical protein